MAISKKFLRRCLISLATVSILTTLYFLSVGPAVYLSGPSHRGEAFLRFFYAPIIWLHENTSMKEPLARYVRFFERH